MSFVDAMRNETNKTKTTNGDEAFKSTLDSNIDVFMFAGASRNDSNIKSKVLSAFPKALDEDFNMALRNLINVRDFRIAGMGERDMFREMFLVLPMETQTKMLILIPTIGRWDDMVYVAQHTKYQTVSKLAYKIMSDVLNADEIAAGKGEQVSLLAKWLPSDKGSKTPQSTKSLLKLLGFKSKRAYRHTLSAIRPSYNLVETNLTERTYEKIELTKVPSRAFQKYKTAFYTYMPQKMEDLVSKVQAGEAVIKTAGVTPNEILKSLISQEYSYGYNSVPSVPDSVIEAQWASLPDLSEFGNTLVMADVSGSMSGQPMEVSVALAIYFAEQMTGEFHNMFMTFAGNPEFVQLSDNMSLRQKVKETVNANWDMSTNLEKAFQLILNVAVKAQLPQDEIPETLVIISDMQFNTAVRSNNSVFESARVAFENAGYIMPNVVFWNVDGATTPVKADSNGVALVSGYSPSVMNAVTSGDLSEFTPTSIMTKQLMNPKYTELLELALL